MTQTERITEMEQNLDEAVAAIAKLHVALKEYLGVQDKIAALMSYYSGGDWMKDYEADAAGLLPHDLKRGVLSEDSVFDLISDNRATAEMLEESIKKLSL